NNIEQAGLGPAWNACSYAPDAPVARIVTNPVSHIVIPLFPCNAATIVTQVTQKFRELAGIRGGSNRKDGFDVRDTVKSIQRRNENFWLLGRTDKCSGVRKPKKLSGNGFNAGTGGPFGLRC